VDQPTEDIVAQVVQEALRLRLRALSNPAFKAIATTTRKCK
jgi:hypothetical protein